jgi:hypothetical protein
MHDLRRYLVALALVVSFLIGPAASGVSAGADPSVPALDHMFVIVEENHGFSDVIGNPAAPNLNSLANKFGVATQYFGVAHPSEPNYVALLGGNFFGIADDNPYWLNRVDKPSLISQLDQAGISWKAYLQGSPHPGYQGICYPAKCNGAPDTDPLYVSKHDAIQNFATSLNPTDWSRQVPIERLSNDLTSGQMPRFNYVIPDECHDMHGDPPYCIDGGNPFDAQDQRLVTIGDQYLGQLVSAITSAAFWSQGNNAIAIVFDEGDDNAGCCDAPTGGGQVAAVVVTSHGPRKLADATPYNHYSLLSTIQHAFGLGCLEFTCDTAQVQPMSPLFAVTGSAAVATSPLPVPDYPTPTPTPSEPVSSTTNTPSAGGWKVQPAPILGTNDNSLGAVAGSSPHDVWAVGNFLPDTDNSNQDATLSLTEHYNGTTWSAVPSPNAGPNFNTLFGVAAASGKAWGVGVRLDADYQDRALVESWDGSKWTIVNNPQPGSVRDLFYAVSADSASDVWAVGSQEGSNGKFETLVERSNGSSWAVVPSPNPGSTGNFLYGLDAVSPDNVWAVGQRLGDQAPDQTLIEHWNGSHWTVVPSPVFDSASALLDAVTVADGEAWAVGETDDPVQGARPLVERFDDGAWRTVDLPHAAGSRWTDLFGVTAADGTVWAVGTFVDPASGNNETLILRGEDDEWTVSHGPNPGSGSNILGGIASVGDRLWAVGTYEDGGSRLPLIESHSTS